MSAGIFLCVWKEVFHSLLKLFFSSVGDVASWRNPQKWLCCSLPVAWAVLSFSSGPALFRRRPRLWTVFWTVGSPYNIRCVVKIVDCKRQNVCVLNEAPSACWGPRGHPSTAAHTFVPFGVLSKLSLMKTLVKEGLSMLAAVLCLYVFMRTLTACPHVLQICWGSDRPVDRLSTSWGQGPLHHVTRLHTVLCFDAYTHARTHTHWVQSVPTFTVISVQIRSSAPIQRKVMVSPTLLSNHQPSTAFFTDSLT